MPLLLKNVKDSEICPCAKFRFNYIFVARNIANKHFSLKKAPDPGLKHLEQLVMRDLHHCQEGRTIYPLTALKTDFIWPELKALFNHIAHYLGV